MNTIFKNLNMEATRHKGLFRILMGGVGSVFEIMPPRRELGIGHGILPSTDADELQAVWNQVADDLWFGIRKVAQQHHFEFTVTRARDESITVRMRLPSTDATGSTKRLSSRSQDE